LPDQPRLPTRYPIFNLHRVVERDLLDRTQRRQQHIDDPGRPSLTGIAPGTVRPPAERSGATKRGDPARPSRHRSTTVVVAAESA
jgi:hypothetical protein